MRVGAQAHVFGLTIPSIIARIRSLPWLASLDSSKWLVAYRAMEVLRISGTGQCHASQFGLLLTQEEMAVNNMRVMRFWLTTEQPMQRSLFEDVDDEVQECDLDQDEAFRYMVTVNDSIYEAFIARFASWVISSDREDEDEDLVIGLEGPSTLEQDIILYVTDEQVEYDSYSIWKDDECVA